MEVQGTVESGFKVEYFPAVLWGVCDPDFFAPDFFMNFGFLKNRNHSDIKLVVPSWFFLILLLYPIADFNFSGIISDCTLVLAGGFMSIKVFWEPMLHIFVIGGMAFVIDYLGFLLLSR